MSLKLTARIQNGASKLAARDAGCGNAATRHSRASRSAPARPAAPRTALCHFRPPGAKDPRGAEHTPAPPLESAFLEDKKRKKR